MGVGISYMGTKRELAVAVADVVAGCKPGPVLDVFSGMCSVAETVAPTRQVWTNDVQVFAYQVAQALFLSSEYPLRSLAVADRYHGEFVDTFSKLSPHFQDVLDAEDEVVGAANIDELRAKRAKLTSALNSAVDAAKPEQEHLFSTQYADTFVGVRQALEIDAIVSAVRAVDHPGGDCARWLMIALGRAMLRVSNSTGHFAQYLEPKEGNFRTFQRQRKRRIWREWLESNDDLEPVGSPSWRCQNRAFNEDSLILLPKLKASGDVPSVIYADPPYTNDQYSRYYHLLETLILYDYPPMSGKGRYRPNRFSTSFSLKAKAAHAMEQIVSSSAEIGADIVLSYPTNGLVHDAGVDPRSILARHYRNVEVCHALEHRHSTLGASKGASKALVTEMIYRGRA